MPESSEDFEAMQEAVSPSVPRGTTTQDVFGERLPLAQRYAELLATTGAERGLIGPREVPRLWERHLLNCGVVAELVPHGVELADVGSGAGLPGLVLAIARPDLEVSLIEPLLRRSTWLREVVVELELTNVQVMRGRAEEVARSGARFDVVTARAVAALPKLAGWCLPLLKPHGQLLAIKGESAAEELATAGAELTAAGVTDSRVLSLGSLEGQPVATVVSITAGVAARRKKSTSRRR